MFNRLFARFLPARAQLANSKPGQVLFVAPLSDWRVLTAASRAMGLDPVAGYTQALAEYQAGNGIDAAVIVLPCVNVNSHAIADRVRCEKGSTFPLFVYCLDPDVVPAAMRGIGVTMFSRREVCLHDLLSKVRASVIKSGHSGIFMGTHPNPRGKSKLRS